MKIIIEIYFYIKLINGLYDINIKLKLKNKDLISKNDLKDIESRFDPGDV